MQLRILQGFSGSFPTRCAISFSPPRLGMPPSVTLVVGGTLLAQGHQGEQNSGIRRSWNVQLCAPDCTDAGGCAAGTGRGGAAEVDAVAAGDAGAGSGRASPLGGAAFTPPFARQALRTAEWNGNAVMALGELGCSLGFAVTPPWRPVGVRQQQSACRGCYVLGAVVVARQHPYRTKCPTSRPACCTHLAEMRGCSGSRSLAALDAGNAGGGVMPDLLEVLPDALSGFNFFRSRMQVLHSAPRCDRGCCQSPIPQQPCSEPVAWIHDQAQPLHVRRGVKPSRYSMSCSSSMQTLLSHGGCTPARGQILCCDAFGRRRLARSILRLAIIAIARSFSPHRLQRVARPRQRPQEVLLDKQRSGYSDTGVGR